MLCSVPLVACSALSIHICSIYDLYTSIYIDTYKGLATTKQGVGACTVLAVAICLQ